MLPVSKQPTDFTFNRFHIDLASQEVRHEKVACEDLEDVLGGIARGFKLLADRPVKNPYDPAATLILNLGILSGSNFMTGLRTFFHAYSPLKGSVALKGGVDRAPAPMWTAGSGKFATKLRHLGIDEIIFENSSRTAMLLHVTAGPEGSDGPEFHFLDATDLSGKTIHDKIMVAHERWPESHVAAIGPAGEAFENVRYAAIGLSTINEFRSGDNKPRFCGRGGIGGVMGSKNLLAIVADIKDPKSGKAPDIMKEINGEVARGKGSARFRDKSKGNGGGGTWANYEGLGPIHAVPEYNFIPGGQGESNVLHRTAVEDAGEYVIKDEACYRCGIRCHKNVYDKGDDGKAGKFRAKLDYEPLNLLSSNLGIFDLDQACELVELVDLLGMDSISIGVTLSYAMEYNKRHPDAPIANGITYGDYEGTLKAIEEIGRGRMPQLGQGTLRLGAELGEPGYAMHCKGVEFPAYLPQINPGYPFALAGGHMSMATYLLYVYEKEGGQDYWVDAITRRGIKTLRDDVVGICKFSGMRTPRVCEAIEALNGLTVGPKELDEVVLRTYLRGYRAERNQGFTEADYDMPLECHEKAAALDMPHFNTKEFFDEMKGKVLARFEKLATERGI